MALLQWKEPSDALFAPHLCCRAPCLALAAFLNEKSQTTAMQAAVTRDSRDTSPLVDPNSPSCFRKPGLSPLLQLDPASPSRWTQSRPTSMGCCPIGLLREHNLQTKCVLLQLAVKDATPRNSIWEALPPLPVPSASLGPEALSTAKWSWDQDLEHPNR